MDFEFIDSFNTNGLFFFLTKIPIKSFVNTIVIEDLKSVNF